MAFVTRNLLPVVLFVQLEPQSSVFGPHRYDLQLFLPPIFAQEVGDGERDWVDGCVAGCFDGSD